MVVPFETDTEDPEVRAMRAKIYREEDVWPLESREEAMLFRHYVQKQMPQFAATARRL